MRVVAGTAGGIPLHIPKTDLRPTMDVVKGAIFSSLADMVVEARVLDLFAGSGGLGIEALSRGARHVVMVENERRAVETIRKNMEKTRLAGAVHEMDVFSYLDRLAAPGAFDLIIADPPYAKKEGDRDFTNELLASENLRAALAPGGIFVLEHRPGAKLPLKDRWRLIRQKRYGATEVAMLRVAKPGDGELEGGESEVRSQEVTESNPGQSEVRSEEAGEREGGAEDREPEKGNPHVGTADANLSNASAPQSNAIESHEVARVTSVPEGHRTIAGWRKPPEIPAQSIRPGGTADHARHSRGARRACASIG